MYINKSKLNNSGLFEKAHTHTNTCTHSHTYSHSHTYTRSNSYTPATLKYAHLHTHIIYMYACIIVYI